MPHSTYYNAVNIATHNKNVDDYKLQGYRMIDISLTLHPPYTRYTASWVKGDVEPPSKWEASVQMNRAQCLQKNNELAQQGLFPTSISVSGMDNDVEFAGIWESFTAPDQVWNDFKLDIPKNKLDETIAKIKTSGMVLSIREYGTWDARYYAILFANSKQAFVHGTCEYSVTPNNTDDPTGTHQGMVDAETTKPGWHSLSVTGSDKYLLSATYCDTEVGDWYERMGIKEAELASVLKPYTDRGWVITNLQEYGSPNTFFYDAIVQSTYPAQKREWRTHKALSKLPDKGEIDSKIEQFMRDQSIRKAQVAVARHGTVLFNHAYSWCEPARKFTGPDDVFLLASLSKALCCAAVQWLYDHKPEVVKPTSKAYGLLGYADLPPDQGGDITVQQLVDHVSGINEDPVFNARSVAIQESKSEGREVAPVTAADFVNYMSKIKVGESGKYSYNNYGYVLLSLIVERHGGQSTYYEFLRANILKEYDLDIRLWPTAKSEHDKDPVQQENDFTGPNALTPLEDTEVANVFGGADFVMEACVGPSSLAASASTMVRFLKDHAYVGTGIRTTPEQLKRKNWPGEVQGKSGWMSGAAAWMSSRDYKDLDLCILFNTDMAWGEDDDAKWNKFDYIFTEIDGIVDTLQFDENTM